MLGLPLTKIRAQLDLPWPDRSIHACDWDVLPHFSSVIVLNMGKRLSAPGARPGDSAMPEEDYVSEETTSLVQRLRCGRIRIGAWVAKVKRKKGNYRV